MFTPLQVYHPYVDLKSGLVQPECLLKGHNFWISGGLLHLVQGIWNLLNDTANQTGILPPGVTSLANPEAAKIKQTELGQFFKIVSVLYATEQFLGQVPQSKLLNVK